LENRAVCEITCKNTVQSDTPQITIWRMRFAYWISKTRDTHSELCNTYCFSTATMVARTRLNVTLDVHCMSCMIRRTLTNLHSVYWLSCWQREDQILPKLPVLHKTMSRSAVTYSQALVDRLRNDGLLQTKTAGLTLVTDCMYYYLCW